MEGASFPAIHHGRHFRLFRDDTPTCVFPACAGPHSTQNRLADRLVNPYAAAQQLDQHVRYALERAVQTCAAVPIRIAFRQPERSE